MENLIKFELIGKRLIVLFKTSNKYLLDYDYDKDNSKGGWQTTINAEVYDNETCALLEFEKLKKDLKMRKR